MNQSKDICGQIQPTGCKLVTFVLDIRIQILPHLLRIMKTENFKIIFINFIL